jgi:hypothetical protein
LHHRLALRLLVAFIGAWLGAFWLALASARLPAETDGWVLAIFPPGLDGPAVSARIIDAGGFPAEPIGAPFAWTAYSPVDGFVGRLRAQGAMLVIPPLGAPRFAGICGSDMEPLPLRADAQLGAR